MHLPNNTLLQGGKYKIIRFISAGGFGCTYEAEHVMLGKRVAIKEFFVKDFCNCDETTSHVTVGTQSKVALVSKLKKKFIEEASALSRFNHPNIVHVSDVFEENGTAYYVMDYIDGRSIHEILKTQHTIPEAQAVKYITQVAEALKQVHAQNRLHLDIKPGNIIIDSNDNAILIDFGASKQYDEVDGENTSTLIGRTPGYAPLEQLGNDIVKFMPATDIYALGATLYKMLSGKTPLSATLLASGEELEPLTSNISKSIRDAVVLCMNVNKKKRPQSLDELISLFGNASGELTNNTSCESGEITVLDGVESNTGPTRSHNFYKIYSKELEQEAFAGDANALKALGDCYLNGLGIKEDENYAFRLYSKAAEQNNVEAKIMIINCYLRGLAVEKDVKKAISLATIGAEQGNLDIMYTLFSIYDDEDSMYSDQQKAKLWKKRFFEGNLRLAEQGDKYAQYKLGECYSDGIGTIKIKKKSNFWYQKAFEQYLNAAEQGDIEAQRILATYYSNGLGGIKKDKNKAAHWRELVAENGDAEYQYNLAYEYKEGELVPKNMKRAIYWYTKAAEGGYPLAQESLATCYYNGEGVKENIQKALYWYTKAAELGDADSQIALGDYYINEDLQKANYWYRQAFEYYSKKAERGDELAQLELGRIYKEGKGVEKDRKKAKYWFNKVVAQNGYAKILAEMELEEMSLKNRIIDTISDWF